MTDGTVYRVYACQNGHEWDVFGDWIHNVFVADDLKSVRCPVCDDTAVDLDGDEPEKLT